MFGYKLAFLMFAAIFFRGCDAKIVVDPVEPGTEAPANGVIYALPNTVVRMQVKLDRTQRVGARFAPYAAIFAPTGTPACKTEACTEEGKLTYSLQDGATFATYGEPDPEKVFMVKFVGKKTVDQTLSMTWNETGLLSAASATVTNRTGDVALSALKLAAGLGTKAAFGGGGDGAAPPVCPDGQVTPNDRWVIDALLRDGRNGPTLVANYCAIESEERAKLPDNQTLLKEAMDAYVREIQPLLIVRVNILDDAAESSEPVALLARIESEINERLTRLYLGTKKTETWDGALDVRRVQESSPLTVLRINKTAGICLTPEAVVPPAVKPLPAKFEPKNKDAACAAATPINLTLSYYPRSDRQLFTKIKDVGVGDRSFRYRLPAQVMAELAVDEKTKFGSGIFSVAQLGKVISLPASRRSKGLTYELAFIESTGALKSFKLGSVGSLDAATVDALGGVGGTLLDARRTEAEALTQQLQLIKLKDDICTIQKKYNLPCTVEPE